MNLVKDLKDWNYFNLFSRSQGQNVQISYPDFLVQLRKDVSTSQLSDYNFQLSRGGLIFGQEYLSHFHKKIINTPAASLKCLFSGDSTTTGDASGVFPPPVIFKNFLNTNGFISDVINAGHSGWSLTAYNNSAELDADILQSPDLYTLRWGINDGITNDVNLFRSSLVSVLTKIRSSLKQEECSIVLMTPNSTNDTPNNRDASWYQKIVPIIRQCAIDFQCCYIDTYNLWNDSIHGSDYMDNYYGDGRHIHPSQVMNYWIMSKFIDVVIPRMFISNQLTNFSVTNGEVTGITIPNSYPLGISLYVSSSGFPVDGVVITTRQVNNVSHQKNCSHVNATTDIYERVSRNDGTSWSPWIKVANENNCILKDAMSLTPKTLLATPIADRLEYDGTDLYMTNSGGVRKKLAYA